ncbi:MAG: hypothetical protein ACK6CU_12680 [Deltaproteobacteria bacterium]
MAQVRGSVITARLKWVRDRFGEPAVRHLKNNLSAASRARLDARVQPHDWVPFALYLEVTREMDRLWGKGDLSLAHELGRATADFSLPTILKIFLRFGAPDHTVRQGAKLWRQFYDSGTPEVRPLSDAEGEGCSLTLPDVETPDVAHCGTILGWMERSVELSGAKIRWARETSCRTRGDAACVFELRWER